MAYYNTLFDIILPQSIETAKSKEPLANVHCYIAMAHKALGLRRYLHKYKVYNYNISHGTS